MTTSLVQATGDLLRIRRSPYAGEAEMQRAVDAFLHAVRATGEPGELRRALELDRETLLLPPEPKNEAYERLLELIGRDPATLREYAMHLLLHGPDWDEKADAILAEARGEDPDPG